MDIPLVPYDGSECDGDPKNPTVTWQQYYGFRNEILKALRPFGTVGPMGECIINDDEDGPPHPWPIECGEWPDYFILDDMWNDWSFCTIVETDLGRITEEVLEAMRQVLSNMPPHWAIYIKIPNGQILLFADKVMARGVLFTGIRSIDDIFRRCS